MKRYTLLALILLSFLAASAQSISVKSFQPLPYDGAASSLNGKRIDQNGEVAAIIKVVTTETGFSFEGGRLGIVDTQQRNGEIWVWVPRGLRKITILHQKLGVLRDYMFPVEIEAERTYEMVLTTGKVKTIIEDEVQEQFLVFQISPADAMLEVNDEVWPVSSEGTSRRLMNFGTYTYRVQAQNYHTEAGQVTVNDPDDAKMVQIILQPNFGWIEVSGEGHMKGAAVYIDNTLAGKAPLKSEPLKSGPHIVKIVREMYEPYSTTVTVADNETTQVKPELTANFAHVILQVDADAEIWVNDEKKGIRSWSGDLACGTCKIECRQTNHENSVTRLDITHQKDGEVITLEAPMPITGSLVVESTPDMATLFIDGKDEGKTPKLIKKILIGPHELKLTKEGYSDHVEKITIVKEERTQVNATLDKKTEAVQQATKVQPLSVNASSAKLSDQTFTVNGVSFTMKPVETGSFKKGSPSHTITLSSYYIGEFEVTQKLWKAVMGRSMREQYKLHNKPGVLAGVGKNFPIYYVSWNECQEFIKKLNQLTGQNFRLPTEAEWEFAARGGNKSKGYKYSGSNNIDEVAWYDGNSKKSHPVGKKSPNELGLYDMSGNVKEFCQDGYGSTSTYPTANVINPKGAKHSEWGSCVLRGGDWDSRDSHCGPSIRFSTNNNNDVRKLNGFRLAMSAEDDRSIYDDWDDQAKQATTMNYGKELEGALPGKFSVSATEQVYFSQGNLQYRPSTKTWRFAEKQWHYYGVENDNRTATYNGWIDFFGWGTSGWDCGNVYFQPWNNETCGNADGSGHYGDYGPPGRNDMTGAYSNSDWGVYNAISNGGNSAGIWRTLTSAEWSFVFNKRTTPSGIRYAKVSLGGVCGIILLPDDWNPDVYRLKDTNTENAEFKSNYINTLKWAELEKAGVVFLPAAGYGAGGVIASGEQGEYWSASAAGEKDAGMVSFWDEHCYHLYTRRDFGLSVRLVRSVK